MRVLLQNSETKLYFAGPNEWTEDPTKAINFEHIDRATEVFTSENLAYAEIVLEPERKTVETTLGSGDGPRPRLTPDG